MIDIFLGVVVLLLIMMVFGGCFIALILLLLDAVGVIPRTFLNTLLGTHEDSFW